MTNRQRHNALAVVPVTCETASIFAAIGDRAAARLLAQRSAELEASANQAFSAQNLVLAISLLVEAHEFGALGRYLARKSTGPYRAPSMTQIGCATAHSLLRFHVQKFRAGALGRWIACVDRESQLRMDASLAAVKRAQQEPGRLASAMLPEILQEINRELAVADHDAGVARGMRAAVDRVRQQLGAAVSRALAEAGIKSQDLVSGLEEIDVLTGRKARRAGTAERRLAEIDAELETLKGTNGRIGRELRQERDALLKRVAGAQATGSDTSRQIVSQCLAGSVEALERLVQAVAQHPRAFPDHAADVLAGVPAWAAGIQTREEVAA